ELDGVLQPVPAFERQVQPGTRQSRGPGSAGGHERSAAAAQGQPGPTATDRHTACRRTEPDRRSACGPAASQHPSSQVTGGTVLLVVEPSGNIHCLYTEELHLSAFGMLSISRGSHVEPTSDGQWQADMSPVNGPILGPFPLRSDALA